MDNLEYIHDHFRNIQSTSNTASSITFDTGFFTNKKKKNLEPAEWAIANAILKYCEKKIKIIKKYQKNSEYPEANADIQRVWDQLNHLKRMQTN